MIIFFKKKKIFLYMHYYTITVLERDQYEVLWSRIQQYWTRRSRVQYCCTLLHKTSSWSSSSVVIVLLHMALFYSNFEILWKFWNFWHFLKILSIWIFWKSYEIFESLEILLKFWILNKISNFRKFLKFSNLKKNWPLNFLF